MKFAFKFSNLLGSVYHKGNLLFTPDGNSVISPVGNRISIFDLKNNKSKTLSLESKYNYTALGLSPNGGLLVAVNEKGEAQMISMVSTTVIHKYKFYKEVKAIKFSPDGRHFACCLDNKVYIFKTPGQITGEYNSFVTKRIYAGALDDTTCLDWSDDGKVIALGSKDNTTRLYTIEPHVNFRPYVLSGHSDVMVSCFFEQSSLNMNTLSRNGRLCLWECSLRPEELVSLEQTRAQADEPTEKRAREGDSDSEDDIDLDKALEKSEAEQAKAVDFTFDNTPATSERDAQGKLIVKSEATKTTHPFSYKRLARHYLTDEPRKENPNAKLTAAAYNKQSRILVAAFSTGAFYLFELPSINIIHSLTISEYQIDAVCFNNTGDWFAVGVSGLGQLLVWEWQSEQYVMKQQGHSSEMNTLAYAPDGQYVATGGEDGKVKLWNVSNGFCFITFSEHTSAVTDLTFSQNKKFLVSCSLDGTVRAYDIIRYRNFRTFTSPRPVQFVSVALDHSGELIAAGGQDEFEIYLWSIKLGRLLEVLSGHEAPVCTLAFAPLTTSSMLVSGSWDKSIKIWDSLETSGAQETIDFNSEVTCVTFHPSGEEVAVATLDGNVSVFSVKSNQQLATIEGRKDMGSGVSEIDLVSAKKNLEGKAFTSITYSADGDCLLAGGRSPNVCIYHVKEGILLKKFVVTQNHSFDGLDEFINRRNITEFGNLALVEERDDLEGGNVNIRLPGVAKGDMAARNFKPEIRVFAVRFSPTGQAWAAATTEGLLIYSLDKGIVFDPYLLTEEVTPKAARSALANGDFSEALLMALKLNETNLLQDVIEHIPHREVELVVAALPVDFAHRTLQFVAKLIPASPHVQFYLKWVTAIITQHGALDNGLSQQTLVTLHQNLNHKYELLSRVCDFNKYTLQTLKSMAAVRGQQDMVSGRDRYSALLRSSEAEEAASDEDMEQVRRDAMDLSMSEDDNDVDEDGSEE